MKWLLVVFGLVLGQAQAEGATYYVAMDGADGNSCVQARSASTPKRTLTAGLACLRSGDTLTIGAGTYAESIAPGAIPSGLSDDARTVVQSVRGEVVTIKPVIGNSIGDAVSIYDRRYITLDGLNIDGSNVATMALRIGGNRTYAHHITVKNGRVRSGSTKRKPQTCITQQGPPGANSNLRFINLEIMDCGPSNGSGSGHGIYLTARDSVIEGCRIYGAAKVGIHAYAREKMGINNNVIRDNIVANNGSVGILLGAGHNNLVYHNLIYGNGHLVGGGSGIWAAYGVADSRIIDNRIYNNRGHCIRIRSDAVNSVVKNNSCWSNSDNSILDESRTSAVADNVFKAGSLGEWREPAADLGIREELPQ